MPESAYIKDCLSRRVLFFTGKGGVGKTSLAWATALACSRRGAKVRVASWNPYEAAKPASGSGFEAIAWQPLTTMGAFKEYALRTLKFERVYNMVFENNVLKAFIRAAPGLADSVIGGKIWDLYDRKSQDLLIVDLPSSGHALSFFKSPLGIEKIFRMGFVHRDVKHISALYGSSDARIDLVALPEELPLEECRQLKAGLKALHPFHFGYLHINQRTPSFDLPAVETLPADLGPWITRYRQRLQAQDEALKLAESIGLPQIEIPRTVPSEARPLLVQIADSLEQA